MLCYAMLCYAMLCCAMLKVGYAQDDPQSTHSAAVQPSRLQLRLKRAPPPVLQLEHLPGSFRTQALLPACLPAAACCSSVSTFPIRQVRAARCGPRAAGRAAAAVPRGHARSIA